MSGSFNMDTPGENVIRRGPSNYKAKQKYHGSTVARFSPYGSKIEGYKYDQNGSLRAPQKEYSTKRDRKDKQKLRRQK